MSKDKIPSLDWQALDAYTARAKVHGGWLVKSTIDVMTKMHPDSSATNGYEWRESICFVPDPNNLWYDDSL